MIDAAGGEGIEVYVDTEKLAPLIGIVDHAVREQIPGARDAFESAESACGFRPISAVRRLLILAPSPKAQKDGSAVIQLDRPVSEALRCIEALMPDAKKTAIDGRPALAFSRGWATAHGELLVLGTSESLVRWTLARLEKPAAAAPDARNLLSGALTAGSLRNLDDDVLDSASWRIESAGSMSRVAARVTFMRVARATEVEQEITQGLAQLRAGADQIPEEFRPVLRQMLDAATLKREGAALDVRGVVPALDGDVGTAGSLLALAVARSRLYITRAKQAEARVTTQDIANRLAAHAAAQKGNRRFPVSAPMVPISVPHARKVLLDAAAFAHPSWRAIDFSLTNPVYYAYEYVTSKDRRTVTVRAIGDLDGDDETSTFELVVKLDAKGNAVVAPEITETKPDE